MIPVMLKKLFSPKECYRWCNLLIPWLTWISLALFVYGSVGGLWLAPADYQQGDVFRIIYIHVPAALMSLLIYITLALAALLVLVWRIKLADVWISAAAPIGAWITFLVLVTGSIWGKPTWGTWWIWDARLTSELILWFLYLGVIALRTAIPDRTLAARGSAILLIVGVINIPIIHYSVYWWNTLHQGATLNFFGPSLIAPSMLHPLLAMIAAFMSYCTLLILLRMRNEILWLERNSSWVLYISNKVSEANARR